MEEKCRRVSQSETLRYQLPGRRLNGLWRRLTDTSRQVKTAISTMTIAKRVRKRTPYQNKRVPALFNSPRLSQSHHWLKAMSRPQRGHLFLLMTCSFRGVSLKTVYPHPSLQSLFPDPTLFGLPTVQHAVREPRSYARTPAVLPQQSLSQFPQNRKTRAQTVQCARTKAPLRRSLQRLKTGALQLTAASTTRTSIL